MKYPFPLLLALSVLRALAAEPTILPVGSIIPVPVALTNGQFLAYWYPPSYIERTNTSVWVQPTATKWVAEASTDGVNWTASRSECVRLPSRAVRASRQPCLSCLHFTEVAATTDQVRIRLIAY